MFCKRGEPICHTFVVTKQCKWFQLVWINSILFEHIVTLQHVFVLSCITVHQETESELNFILVLILFDVPFLRSNKVKGLVLWMVHCGEDWVIVGFHCVDKWLIFIEYVSLDNFHGLHKVGVLFVCIKEDGI